MIITAKDKGSILRKEHARQFLKAIIFLYLFHLQNFDLGTGIHRFSQFNLEDRKKVFVQGHLPAFSSTKEFPFGK